MRVGTHLAIIILTCLAGGYGIEYSLDIQHKEIQTLTERHGLDKLAVKDYTYLHENISQLLITVDLILGSDETYLISGAMAQTHGFREKLKKLSSSEPIFNGDEGLSQISLCIDKIHGFLNSAQMLDDTDRERGLADLLNRYDKTSIRLVEDLDELRKNVSARMEESTGRLDRKKARAEQLRIAVTLLFSFVILGLWYWSNRNLSRPIHTLSLMANQVKDSGKFKGIDKAPKEVMVLSKRLETLTNSLIDKAIHDPLTNLINRREFERHLAQVCSASRNKDETVVDTLLYLDLDRFKIVNDTCGHGAGDELLVQVSQVLCQSVRGDDAVARIGGDEFAILLRGCPMDHAQELANRLRSSIEAIQYQWGEECFRISASIGLCRFSGEEVNIAELVNAADAACAVAKESGRNRVCVLDPDDDRFARKRFEMLYVNQLNTAIDESNFVLFRQNIVPLAPDAAQGEHYEVLIRMRAKDGALIGPGEFLHIVERYHLGVRLDKWVVENCLSWLMDHPDQLEKLTLCSINLSGQSVSSAELCEFIITLLKETGFPGQKICFEITETAAISDLQQAMEFISKLKVYGVRFALDDFGSGHSSFGYLKDLLVDFIKIDGRFIKDMLKDEVDLATVESITAVGQATGKQIVAEFVETADVAEKLRQIGVNFAQGYYFDKPVAMTADVTTPIAETASG